MRLITNNPRKRKGLKGFGLEIVDRVSIEIPPNRVNRDYLQAKRDKMGHRISLDEEGVDGAERSEAEEE